MGPVAALAFAAGAAVLLAVSDRIGWLDPGTELLFVGTWLLGWALLCWAVLVSAASAVPLLRRAVTRQPVSRSGAVLLGAALALIAVLVWTHPLWGSGSGSGTAT
jgi:hypothetical protein